MAIKIGPSFGSELAAAGLSCNMSWQGDGTLLFAQDVTDDTKAKVHAVLDAHDPAKAAPLAVPPMVTNYQARAALVAAGKFDATDKAVRASGDTLTIQAWDYANNFYRSSAFIDAMGRVLGMKSADIDALFVAAGAVQ